MTKSIHVYHAAGIVLCLSSVSGAIAQTQPLPVAGPDYDWTIEIGAGAIYGFTPGGEDTDQININPWGAINYQNRYYANGLDGIGWNMLSGERIRAGLQLRPSYSTNSTVEGIETPDLGADLAAYSFHRLGRYSVGGRVQYDVSDVSGGIAYYGSVARRDMTPIGQLQSQLFFRGGDEARNEAYFAISDETALETGLPAYNPDAGLQSAGFGFLLMTPLSRQYAMGSFVNYERAIGEAADSPLILNSKNEEDTWRLGVIFVRRFTSQP